MKEEAEKEEEEKEEKDTKKEEGVEKEEGKIEDENKEEYEGVDNCCNYIIVVTSFPPPFWFYVHCSFVVLGCRLRFGFMFIAAL